MNLYQLIDILPRKTIPQPSGKSAKKQREVPNRLTKTAAQSAMKALRGRKRKRASDDRNKENSAIPGPASVPQPIALATASAMSTSDDQPKLRRVCILPLKLSVIFIACEVDSYTIIEELYLPVL